MEHAFIFRNRQVDEKWAIIRLCQRAHSVGPYATCGILNKEINQWIGLRHASEADLKKYPRAGWEQKKKYLSLKYG